MVAELRKFQYVLGMTEYFLIGSKSSSAAIQKLCNESWNKFKIIIFLCYITLCKHILFFFQKLAGLFIDGGNWSSRSRVNSLAINPFRLL